MMFAFLLLCCISCHQVLLSQQTNYSNSTDRDAPPAAAPAESQPFLVSKEITSEYSKIIAKLFAPPPPPPLSERQDGSGQSNNEPKPLADQNTTSSHQKNRDVTPEVENQGRTSGLYQTGNSLRAMTKMSVTGNDEPETTIGIFIKSTERASSADVTPPDDVIKTYLAIGDVREKEMRSVSAAANKPKVNEETSVAAPSGSVTKDSLMNVNAMTEKNGNDAATVANKAQLSSDRKKFIDLQKDLQNSVVSIEMDLSSSTNVWSQKEEISICKTIADCLVDYLSNWTQPTMFLEETNLLNSSDVHFVDETPFDRQNKRYVTFYVSNPLKLADFETFPSEMILRSLRICSHLNSKLKSNSSRIYAGPASVGGGGDDEAAATEPPSLLPPATNDLRSASSAIFGKSDPLVSALIGTTCVSVLGVFVGILCWAKCRKRNSMMAHEDGFNIEQKTISYIKEDSTTISRI